MIADLYMQALDAEPLRTELERSEDALILSDDHLRELAGQLQRASRPSSKDDASDLCKITHAAMALNAHLLTHATKLRSLHNQREAEIACAGKSLLDRIRITSAGGVA